MGHVKTPLRGPGSGSVEGLTESAGMGTLCHRAGGQQISLIISGYILSVLKEGEKGMIFDKALITMCESVAKGTPTKYS